MSGECWRSAVLGEIESELRSRFGGLLVMSRGRYDDREALAICWPGVRTMMLHISPEFSEWEVRLKLLQSVELVAEALWDAAPVAGRC